jgi:hypothetical protein
MKRVLSLLVFVMFLNGCDDGDLVLETINFEDVATQSCSTNDILYKLKEKEALLLEIPKTSFVNEPTPVGEPTEIAIGGSNRVVYRFYNGTVATDNICETIPPATPIVMDQWIATAGTIQIITTPVKTTDATTNATSITGYNHNIVFKNITFLKSDGTQVYETFLFGDHVTPATSLPFAFDETLDQCSTSKQIYNYNSSESLTLDIDPLLLSSAAINVPKTGLISATTNKLRYRLFSGLLTSDYFCITPEPASPIINEEWNAVAGVQDVSGIIEVTKTTDVPGVFKYTIVLKKVTFKKGITDFKLGDSYEYGVLLLPN